MRSSARSNKTAVQLLGTLLQFYISRQEKMNIDTENLALRAWNLDLEFL